MFQGTACSRENVRFTSPFFSRTKRTRTFACIPCITVKRGETERHHGSRHLRSRYFNRWSNIKAFNAQRFTRPFSRPCVCTAKGSAVVLRCQLLSLSLSLSLSSFSPFPLFVNIATAENRPSIVLSRLTEFRALRETADKTPYTRLPRRRNYARSSQRGKSSR